MRVVLLSLLTLVPASPLFAQAPPPAFAVKQFNDGAQWIVVESFPYQIGKSKLVVDVPQGFVTDYASIPEGPLRARFIPTGQYGRAAVIHDYLYWTQWCSRDQADRIFLFAMIESKVPPDTRTEIYEAVRLGGQSSWLGNQKERELGLPRIIPADFIRQIDPLAVWSTYRRRLYELGVRPEPRPAPLPAYCGATEDDLR